MQTQDTRDKQMLRNQKRKRGNGRGGASALMHRPAAVEAAPSPEKRGEFAHTASRPTLLLHGRRYPEAQDLRWTKYGCCSNSINCYNRRFLNVQHSIDGPMGHGFGCADGSCIDWHQRHVRVFSALYPLAV